MNGGKDSILGVLGCIRVFHMQYRNGMRGRHVPPSSQEHRSPTILGIIQTIFSVICRTVSTIGRMLDTQKEENVGVTFAFYISLTAFSVQRTTNGRCAGCWKSILGHDCWFPKARALDFGWRVVRPSLWAPPPVLVGLATHLRLPCPILLAHICMAQLPTL